MTQTGPFREVATSRCSGSSAASTAVRLLDTAPILAGVTDAREAATAPVDSRVPHQVTAGGGTLMEGCRRCRFRPLRTDRSVDVLHDVHTAWCGYCHRLKRVLERDGITFAEVDIDRQRSAARIVRSVNGGNATVPTLVFADGSALTNPTPDEVRAKLPGS